MTQRSEAVISRYAQRGDREACGRLSLLDLRAQAAVMRSHVDALPREQRDYVVACHSWGADGLAAAREVVSRCVAVLNGDSYTASLVERHIVSVRMRGSAPLREWARRHGMSHSAARWRDDKVRKVLSVLWLEAENTLYDRWVRAGLIAE